MKKGMLFLLCGVLMSSFVMPVMAQELTQKRKSATFAPGLVATDGVHGQSAQVKRTLPKNARTTILRFEPGQVELSDVQKEMLLHMANHMKKTYAKSVSVVTASKNTEDALLRISKIKNFLVAYVGDDFLYYIRTIQPEYVVPSVDNTVKITINR